MSLDKLNGKLQVLGQLNNGPNTTADFELQALPRSTSLQESLGLHFASFVDWRTQQPHSAEKWHIKTKQIGEKSDAALQPILEYWFFKLPYAPKLEDDRLWVKSNVINDVLETLDEVVGECELHEVFVTPPIWYEGHWQDIAFSRNGNFWLLHLGVTD